MEAAAKQVKDQAELNELLAWAAARGLMADAEELVARGAEPTSRDKQGHCPVHYAAAHGHTEMLQFLAAKGADLEAEDPQARTPLHHAAAHGASLDALRHLVKHATWLNAPDGDDNTPLHLAARRGWLDGIKLLLVSGAAVDAPNKKGLSALGEAVAEGHTEAAEALLAAGASATWRAEGYTLLHVAAGLGRTEALELLLNRQGCSAAAFVSDSQNSDQATPLHAAAVAGCLPAAELLLAHGADAAAAGAGDLLAWQLVELQPRVQDSSSSSSSSSKATPQHAEKLQQLLRKAAGGRGGSTAGKQGGGAAVAAAAAATAALSPGEAYSQEFRQLDAAEQARRVEGLARLPVQEMAQLPHLSKPAKAAIGQVHRANQLLAVYRAVAALRADEGFQEDAADPAVQAALTDMGHNNNMDKYAGQRHVVSVATKLKQFHTVMQECGGVKLGLQDLLIPPGSTLQELAGKDAAQIEGLTKAAAEARAAAVAAIAGSSSSSTGSSSGGRSAGAATAVAAGGCEIEPAVDSPSGEAPGGDTDLDRALQAHRQQRSAAAKPSRRAAVDPESMGFKQRMVYELVESFKRAVKIFGVMLLVFGLMWAAGMLPSQQPQEVLEARMLQMMGGRGVQQQPHVQQAEVFGGEHQHGEL